MSQLDRSTDARYVVVAEINGGRIEVARDEGECCAWHGFEDSRRYVERSIYMAMEEGYILIIMFSARPPVAILKSEGWI